VLGEAQSHANMVVLPILGKDGDGPDFLTLKEALDAGLLSISEVSEGGVCDKPELPRMIKWKWTEKSSNFPTIIGEELAGKPCRIPCREETCST